MKIRAAYISAIIAGFWLLPTSGIAAPPQASQPAPPQVRPIGVVTHVQQGQLTLHTDAGPDMVIQLPENVSALQVPPGAKDLKSATKIALTDISPGDRLLVLGQVSPDQKSVLAKSVIVMSRAALAQAHMAERVDWERRGIGGVVKALNPAAEEITLAVPNQPPTPENPTHLVTLTLKPHAQLLRYAPDSIKFGDAKPSTFGEIEVGDQVRALGVKSPDGTRFAAEKLVSGTFRNIGATVISVNTTQQTITVKDLATGKPVLVRTDADSQMHQLPPKIAYVIARFNSANGAANGGAGGPPNRPTEERQAARGRWRGGAAGEHPPKMGGEAGARAAGMPQNFEQMLARTPPFKLEDLKPGEPLIVVSTVGAKPSEVTAIAVLSGVEPILSARPKGSSAVVLGPWNMGMGGGGAAAGAAGGTGEAGP